MPPLRTRQEFAQTGTRYSPSFRNSGSAGQRLSPIVKKAKNSVSKKRLSTESVYCGSVRSFFEDEMDEHLKNLVERSSFADEVDEDLKDIKRQKKMDKTELLGDLNKKVFNQLVDQRKKTQLILEDVLQNMKLLKKKLNQPINRRNQLKLDLQSMSLLLKDLNK